MLSKSGLKILTMTLRSYLDCRIRRSGLDSRREFKIDPKSYPNGRFARVYDPEGNPIRIVATCKTKRSALGY